MFRRLHRAKPTDPKPTGPVNSMEKLQLSLHQHGASITIAVGLAKRANDHELRHLQDFIAGEMGEVKDIVHEATNEHKKVLHFPRIILSAREEFVRAQQEQREIQWSKISRDDATVKTSQWYQEVQTPTTAPGPNTWWLDVRRAMETREAAMVEGEAADPEPTLGKRKRAEVGELAMEVDERPDDEGERPKKRKGKGKAAQIDADAAMMDGEGEGPVSRQADDYQMAKMEKGKGRAADERKLTPADDTTMQPGQTSCTRCLRLGRKCTAIMGTVCTSCHKSKVSCPLFTGGKQAKSRAPSRLGSVAPALLPASEPGPSSAITPPPITTFPASSPTIGSASAINMADPSIIPSGQDTGRVPSALWEEDEARSRPYRRVTTFSLNAMRARLYKAPTPSGPPRHTKAKPMPTESEEKPVKTSSRGRSLSRPPARTPTVLSTPVRLAEPSQERKEKIILRLPSLAPEGRKKMERAPSAGPSTRQGTAKVFVDIPQISSLEEYSPSVTGNIPASVAKKMAHMENEIAALKRAHEALRQYVISLPTPQHPSGYVLTHPPMNALPHIGADTLPRATADALRAPTSGPLNGPAEPSAPQPLIEVLAELNINSSPRQQTDVEMAPVGHVLGPANGNAPPADMPTDLAQADHYQPASLEDAEVTASAANVEVEGRRRDHNAGGAGEQVDKEAEATSGDVDMTVDPVAEDCRDGEVGQADPCIEVTPTDVAGQSDVGVSMSQAAAGEVGQADPSIEATPTDVAHQPDIGVSMSQAGAGGQLGSLEDGQLPQDQLGLSTCTSPPAQAADSAL